MSFRDRAAGHAILEEGDFTQLDKLPKSVAFQVRMFQNAGHKVWFVGTRKYLRKWAKDDTPFCEFAPLGSPKSMKLATETAASFCKAFDELWAFAKESLPGSQFVGFGPSKKIGELSLGLEIATLLGKGVFSFIDDDDPAEAILACVCEPGRVIRVRCEKAGVHLLFEEGATSVCQLIPQGNAPPFPVVSGQGFAPVRTLDLGAVVERLAQLPGVKKAKPPSDYDPSCSKQLVSQDLNAFVGTEIAEPDTVVPDLASMRLLAQRTAGGKIKHY